MAGARDRPGDSPGAEPHAQPVDAGGKRCAVAFGSGIEIGLRRAERLAPAGAQLHGLDPEAGLECLEPCRKQPDHVAGLAGDDGKLDPAPQHLAINPPQPQFKPPRALTARRQCAHHVGREVFHHPVEQVAVAQRLHQPALDHRHGAGDHRQQRLGHLAQQLVKPQQRIGGRRAAIAESAGKRIARGGLGPRIIRPGRGHSGQLAEPLDPQAAQDSDHIIIKPQRRHRQIA